MTRPPNIGGGMACPRQCRRGRGNSAENCPHRQILNCRKMVKNSVPRRKMFDPKMQNLRLTLPHMEGGNLEANLKFWVPMISLVENLQLYVWISSEIWSVCRTLATLAVPLTFWPATTPERVSLFHRNRRAGRPCQHCELGRIIPTQQDDDIMRSVAVAEYKRAWPIRCAVTVAAQRRSVSTQPVLRRIQRMSLLAATAAATAV